MDISKSSDQRNHDQKLAEQHRSNIALEVSDLILDLESLYQNNFKKGLNQVDLNIEQRCKQQISACFEKLNLYNVYLTSDASKSIKTKEIQLIDPLLEAQKAQKKDTEGGERKKTDETDADEPKVKLFYYVDEYPRCYLIFKPRNIEGVNDTIEKVSAENEYVAKIVNEINQILEKKIPPSIFQVRKKYMCDQDGYLIHLKFNENVTVGDVLSLINDFSETVKSLSLDELMISQQFSENYSVIEDNPYTLQVNSGLKVPQSIRISVHNMRDYAPCYYLMIVLGNIKEAVAQAASLSTNGAEIRISKQYETINDCFVSIELNIKVEEKNDE